MQSAHARIHAREAREIIRDFVELLDILYQNPALTLEELVSDPAFSQRPATLPCEEGEGSMSSAAAQAAQAGFGQAFASRPTAPAAQHIASSGSASAAAAQVTPSAGLGQVAPGRCASQPASSLYGEVIHPAASEAPGTQRVAAEPVAAPRTFAEFTI